MKFCRNCRTLVEDGDIRVPDKTAPLYGECPNCGSDDLTDGCKCDVCGADMEEENIHICPDCIVALKAKFNQFKEHLEDVELEYLEEYLL